MMFWLITAEMSNPEFSFVANNIGITAYITQTHILDIYFQGEISKNHTALWLEPFFAQLLTFFYLKFLYCVDK